MSLDHIAVERLRNDLTLRPLSAGAIRAAHNLAIAGEDRFSAAYKELADVGLARNMGGEQGDWFRPTGMLLDLLRNNRMDVLEAR